MVNGKGGGKPENAQVSGSNPSGAQEAIGKIGLAAINTYCVVMFSSSFAHCVASFTRVILFSS